MILLEQYLQQDLCNGETVECEWDGGYVSIDQHTACLDGDFTANELRLIATKLESQKK